MKKRSFVAGLVLVFSLVFSSQVLAAETDSLADILKKLDALTCTQPEKLPQFYAKSLVIMVDDKRALLENRVKDYRQMMSDFRDMKCETQRQVLSGKVGKEGSSAALGVFACTHEATTLSGTPSHTRPPALC